MGVLEEKVSQCVSDLESLQGSDVDQRELQKYINRLKGKERKIEIADVLATCEKDLETLLAQAKRDKKPELLKESRRFLNKLRNGKKRRPLDQYFTPTDAIRKVLPFLPLKDGVKVLDPSCGDGQILWTAREFMQERGLGEPYLLGTDIDPTVSTACMTFLDGVNAKGTIDTRDFLSPNGYVQADIVIMNPPYSHALPFVQKALQCAPVVASLLRLSFMGGAKRTQTLKDHPSDVYVLEKRPSFTGGGTDATEYAWFVWGQGGGKWRTI